MARTKMPPTTTRVYNPWTTTTFRFEAKDDIMYKNHVMKKGEFFSVQNAAKTSTFGTIFNQGQHCFSGYLCQQFIKLEFNGELISWTDTPADTIFLCRYGSSSVYISPVVKVPNTEVQNRLLEQMYSKKESCGDFTIQCHENSFLVHKAILYCSGEYFKSILDTAGLNETNQLNLSDCSEEVMKQIIHFIYRGDLLHAEELNSNVLLEIYEASKYFQMEPLQELSQSIFISTLKKTGFDYSIIEKVLRTENLQMRIALERTMDQLGGKRLLDAYDTHQSKRQKS